MSEAEPFSHLIVVGSSAGGIEALSELVQTLPADLAAPVVIAQHLEPERVSHLEEILARRSALPVRTVTERAPLEAGVVFVVPADRHVNVTDHEIELSVDPRGRPMPSIDLLFGSAARIFGERLVGVILTGTGSDGTEGARIVSQAGGTVIVQDPESAQYGDMPGSLAPNTVDIVTDLEKIGSILGRLTSGVEEPEEMAQEEEEKQALEGYITERKRTEESLRESEERLQRAIAIETVGVIFFNADGQITEANDTFLQMSGYSREDLEQGLLRWDHMTPPEWMLSSLEAIVELKTTGRTTPYEKEYIRKDGSRWWGLFAATSLGEEEGVEFIIDVTGRKRAEEERERLIAHELTARAQAEERQRLSRELHDRVAHDIALVHQSLELHEALKASDPRRAAAKMQLARRVVKEALESTRDLSMELREREVRRGLEAALANLLRDLVPPTVESNLSVGGDEALVPPEIRSQLFLILREAIRNAVTHSGAAHIAVEVDAGQESVIGRVEDDGSGFDPDEVRATSSGGLRAMSEGATLMGATLDLSSAPGRGTTIEVYVPLGDA